MIQNNKLSENPWLIFFVTGGGACLASIDGGIVNVALPTITKYFNTSNILFSQWTVSSYIFLACIFLPLAGKLGDLYSRRNIYLNGFILFTLSSFLCSIASSLSQLIAFRCLQGLGASLLLANSQALIITTIPKNEHGKALGLNSMITAFGNIAGPGLGGILLHFFSWRSIFFVNIPIGIAACIIGYKILPRYKRNEKIKIDFLGSLLFAITMGAMLLILTKYETWSWNGLYFVSSLIILFAGSVSFYFWERKVEEPMIDFNLFKIRAFLSSISMAFFVFITIATNNILLPFYMDITQNFPPIVIGFIMLIPSLFIIIIAPISGRLADKNKQKTLILVGLICMLTALFTQSLLTAHSPLWRIILSQALLGFGIGFFQSPNNFTIMTSVPLNNASAGSSIAAFMRNFGKISGTVSATAILSLAQNYFLLKHFDKITAFTNGFRISLLSTVGFIAIALAFYFLNLKQQKTPTFET